MNLCRLLSLQSWRQAGEGRPKRKRNKKNVSISISARVSVMPSSRDHNKHER